ncbi:uncharacterized protein LOC122862246 [Siniperca chuatsi]|uniref:uncharacterized protein LOC122862246 n=1 Tax=Siniperca chuatsi TaxID=119488 RepID=UPI001CE1FDEE|nr:uncharacterized protein LOC122862246 [Siniperca chuatsi]
MRRHLLSDSYTNIPFVPGKISNTFYIAPGVRVGAEGAPGYQHVVRLAQSLVALCKKGYITQAEVEEIVGLWENLPDAEKGPVVYPPRCRAQLAKGTIKKSQTYAPNTVAMPGLESMKRCIVGTGSQPAVWPDTSRLVEAIFVQLCGLHPGSKKMKGCLVTRWTLLLRDYNTIRNVVTTHPALRTRTALQLFAVNQATVSQWHKRWTATQERTTPPMQAPLQAEETQPTPRTSVYKDLPPLEGEEEAFPITTSAPPAATTSTASHTDMQVTAAKKGLC